MSGEEASIQETDRGSMSGTGGLLTGLRLCALVALVAFEPVVVGYLWFAHLEANPVLEVMRSNPFFVFFHMFLAAWVGGRRAWLSAPGVRLISGLLYSAVAWGMGEENFAYNMSLVLLYTVVVAFPLGLVVSYYFKHRPGISSGEGAGARQDESAPYEAG